MIFNIYLTCFFPRIPQSGKMDGSQLFLFLLRVCFKFTTTKNSWVGEKLAGKVGAFKWESSRLKVTFDNFQWKLVFGWHRTLQKSYFRNLMLVLKIFLKHFCVISVRWIRLTGITFLGTLLPVWPKFYFLKIPLLSYIFIIFLGT